MGDPDVPKLAAGLHEMTPGSVSAPISLGRRGFLAATAAASLWQFLSGGLARAAQGAAPADVRRFGALGNGIANDTLAFKRAFSASPFVYAPGGTYLVDTVVLPAGARLMTDGSATRFKQRAGIHEDIRILTVRGSNVIIGDCTVEGNIATDAGEQRHGVFVQASPETGPISNVRVGNINGVNLRGDVVYIGCMQQVPVIGIQVANVHASNILRNVVSVVGGRDIRIGNISGTNVGYTHLDIEPDDWNAPVIGCEVASVRGGLVQVAGSTARSFVDGIRLGLLDLDGRAARCVPAYKPGLTRFDALTIRNYRSMQIDRLIVRNFKRYAIFQIWNSGALLDQKVHISKADLRNCCMERGSSYVAGSRHATHLLIDDLTVDIAKPGIAAIAECKSARVARVRGNRPRDSRLIALAPPVAPHFALAIAGGGMTAAFIRLALQRPR